MNIIQFSKATYSFLNLIGYVTLLLSILMYNKFFKNSEFRTLFFCALLVNFFGCVTSLIFVMRWNLIVGISDLIFIIGTSVVTDILAMAFSHMPIMVLFAKITPKHIEATVFALLTGSNNLANGVLSPNMGNFVNNKFVGVTNENLGDFHVLIKI